MPDWVAALKQLGISVARDVRRDERRPCSRYYVESGATIYDARQGG